LFFNASPYKNSIPSQTISLKFLNTQNFSDQQYSQRIEPIYLHGNNWLNFEIENTTGDSLMIKLNPKMRI
jgi:hypothetical protein